MLTWAFPDFTLALGLGLAVLAGLLAYCWRGRRLGRHLGQGAGRLGWKLPMRLLAGAGLLAAWLGPAVGVSRQAVQTTGKDLWLLVDVSRSMDAVDVAPSRLLRARAVLAGVVAQFPADRLGVVAFGGTAVVQCPLTYDQAAVQTFVGTLRSALLPPGPTRLVRPLELLLARLNPPPAAGAAPAPPRSTALLVVSDGEDFGENLEPVLRELARSGVRVYAVGVGTAAGGRIPLAGGGTVRDRRGRVVVSRRREAPLLQLAAQTGGQYFDLTDQTTGLPNLTAALRAMPGTATAVRTVAVAENRYRYPLVLALLLLALDVALTVTVLRP